MVNMFYRWGPPLQGNMIMTFVSREQGIVWGLIWGIFRTTQKGNFDKNKIGNNRNIDRERGRESKIVKGSCSQHPPPPLWEALVVSDVFAQDSNTLFELCFDIKLGDANEENTGGAIWFSSKGKSRQPSSIERKLIKLKRSSVPPFCVIDYVLSVTHI